MWTVSFWYVAFWGTWWNFFIWLFVDSNGLRGYEIIPIAILLELSKCGYIWDSKDFKNRFFLQLETCFILTWVDPIPSFVKLYLKYSISRFEDGVKWIYRKLSRWRELDEKTPQTCSSITLCCMGKCFRRDVDSKRVRNGWKFWNVRLCFLSPPPRKEKRLVLVIMRLIDAILNCESVGKIILPR